MTTRKMTSEHARIGHVAKSEAKQSAWKKINTLTVYPATGRYGEKIVGVTAEHGPGIAPVMYLNPNGAIELVKGILMNLVTDCPIVLVADDEFRNILNQVQAAVKQGDKNAEAVVRAVTGK